MGLSHFRSCESVALFVEYSQAKKWRNFMTRNSLKRKIYEIELPLIREELSKATDWEELAIANYITSFSALQNIYDVIMNESTSCKEIEKTIQYASPYDKKVFTLLTNVNIEIFDDFAKVDFSLNKKS